MPKNLCVIVPVHKESLTEGEAASLHQCKKILQEYDVYLIHPEGMNIGLYTDVFPEIYLSSVPKNWLDSIENYNKMKRSLSFYERFKDYEYMLTYELDAYIFSTNWDIASVFNYDYIGAPWFENYHLATDKDKIVGVGNSGFSIRRIDSCIRILKRIQRLPKICSFFFTLKLHRVIRFTLILRLFSSSWKVTGKNVYFLGLLTDGHVNEDKFWSIIVPQLLNFRIATTEDAIKFSFEVNPSKLYQINNNELPIGCHAWEKYDANFWKDKIVIHE